MATLKASLRSDTGKGAARKLRAAGQVPAVAYGHGVDGRPLSVNAHELTLLLNSINPENTIIDLRVEGAKPAQALIREVQRHPSRPVIMHVDLFQVRAGEKLHVEVPVRLHGTPKGVREEDGVLQEVLRELTVECLPKDIPAGIDIDIEGLAVGEAIHVSDVDVANVAILNDPELVICLVAAPTVAEPTGDAEAGEPDLVGGEEESEQSE